VQPAYGSWYDDGVILLLERREEGITAQERIPILSCAVMGILVREKRCYLPFLEGVIGLGGGGGT
jgi:hypothetical protein